MICDTSFAIHDCMYPCLGSNAGIMCVFLMSGLFFRVWMFFLCSCPPPVCPNTKNTHEEKERREKRRQKGRGIRKRRAKKKNALQLRLLLFLSVYQHRDSNFLFQRFLSTCSGCIMLILFIIMLIIEDAYGSSPPPP